MSDRDPDVTPAQEAQLRRLLADARHGDPVPLDVAARLEAVLEQLAEEGSRGVDPTPVIDLAARRRRLVGSLLVAAAAVVVAGLGIGQLVTPSSSDDSASTATAEAAQDAGGASDQLLAEVAPDAAAADAPVGPDSGALSQAERSDDSLDGDTNGFEYEAPLSGLDQPAVSNGNPPVRLTKRTFTKAVSRIRTRPGVVSTARSRVSASELTRSSAFICPTAVWGEGTLFAAFYDDTPAVLAFRPQQGRTQTAELLQCGSERILRSIVLVIRR